MPQLKRLLMDMLQLNLTLCQQHFFFFFKSEMTLCVPERIFDADSKNVHFFFFILADQVFLTFLVF